MARVFVGDGPLKMRLSEHIHQLGLSKKVELLGTRSDVSDIMKKSDVHILPSLFEGQGIVILEAAAAGNFIIASDTGGITQMITDRVNGFLVKPRDVYGFAAGLEWFFSHRNEALKMSQRAQAFVMEHFHIREITKRYEELYVQLLKIIMKVLLINKFLLHARWSRNGFSIRKDVRRTRP